LRLAIAATPQVAIPSLEFLLTSGHEIVCIITQPDAPAGRGRILTETPVAQWSSQAGITTYKTDKSDEIATLVSSVDLLITIGYGVLLPKTVLDAPTKGCINLHFSLLPAWRGAAPVQRSIEAMDPFTGVTVFQLDEGMDTGPIYSSMRFALDIDITADELFHELAQLGAECLDDSLMKIERGDRPVPQKSDGASRAYKLSKAEGEIDWSRKANEVSAKIRAFTSNPGAWTLYKGQNIKIDTPSLTEIQLPPGELSVVGERVVVGTHDVALEIGYVTPAGKARMDAASWARGARLTHGDHFG
jgi:methionyl-tRNA formyltransferase